MKLPRKGLPGRYLLLVLRTTANNLFFTISTRRGNVLSWSSCGTSGFKGPRRATPLAAEQSARQLADRLAKANFRWLVVEIHSLYSNRIRSALKGLFHGNLLRLATIRLKPPLSHNGSRLPKARRV